MSARRAIDVLACLTLAALTLALVPGGPAGAVSAETPAVRAVVTLRASSTFPRVSGDVLVLYRDGTHSFDVAKLTGRISGMSGKPKIELLASTFPFKHPPVVVASDTPTLSNGSASFSFRAMPSGASRYSVRVLSSSTHGAATLLSSRTEDVFVTVAMLISPTKAPACARPKCEMTFIERTLFPRSDLARESAKYLYGYLGLNLSPKAKPPPPSEMRRYPFTIQKTVNSRTGAVSYRLRFSFAVGSEGYNFVWDTCTKDTFRLDGLGLPSPHDCGDSTIPYPVPFSGYLG